MQSVIKLKEEIENKERKFGSWKKYYPCKIELKNGKTLNALFTKSQLEIAIYRSNKNIEDLEDTDDLIKEFLKDN